MSDQATAAPAAPISATPTPVPAPTPATAPPTTAAPADWTTGLNEDLRGYVSSKGFKDPGMVVDSYRNLEKYTGAPPERIVKIPEKADDVEGWNGVYSKLGRPQKPEEYNMPPVSEADKAYIPHVQKMFHESGLTHKQAEGIYNKMNEYTAGLQKEAQTARQQKFETEDANLKREWGQAFEQNMKFAEDAVAKLGINDEQLAKLDSVMGISQLRKMFYDIGSKTGEAPFVTGQGPSGKGILTPEAARVRIKQLTQDGNYMKRWEQKDNEVIHEMDQLHRWANANAEQQ